MIVAWGLVLAVTIVPGIYLWWPARGDQGGRSDLGAALLTGAVVSFAVFALQLVFDARLRQLEDRRMEEQERRSEQLRIQGERTALQLTVGLQSDLTGIDLHEQNLAGFYLSRKRMPFAVLANADLTEANLSRANLTGADLREARLVRAHLDDATLTRAFLTLANLRGAGLVGARLDEAELSGASLVNADLSGADLTGASLGGASLEGARYDAETRWPDSAAQPPCPSGMTCRAS